MTWINQLEAKLGRFAIPNLLRIVAGFQVIMAVIYYLVNPGFQEILFLDPKLTLDGQVWRLFSWVLVPASYRPIALLFSIYMLFWAGDALESAWGTFRLNLFFFCSVFAVIVVSFTPLYGGPFTPTYSFFLYDSVFLSFAFLFPDHHINLMGVIPIKAKWLGLVAGGLLIFTLVDAPFLIAMAVAANIGFIAYALPVSLRNLRDRGRVAARRARFESQKMPESEAFHTCHSCGKTERDDPHLEFRVHTDDEEYCAECLDEIVRNRREPASNPETER